MLPPVLYDHADHLLGPKAYLPPPDAKEKKHALAAFLKNLYQSTIQGGAQKQYIDDDEIESYLGLSAKKPIYRSLDAKKMVLLVKNIQASLKALGLPMHEPAFDLLLKRLGYKENIPKDPPIKIERFELETYEELKSFYLNVKAYLEKIAFYLSTIKKESTDDLYIIKIILDNMLEEFSVCATGTESFLNKIVVALTPTDSLESDLAKMRYDLIHQLANTYNATFGVRIGMQIHTLHFFIKIAKKANFNPLCPAEVEEISDLYLTKYFQELRFIGMEKSHPREWFNIMFLNNYSPEKILDHLAAEIHRQFGKQDLLNAQVGEWLKKLQNYLVERGLAEKDSLKDLDYRKHCLVAEADLQKVIDLEQQQLFIVGIPDIRKFLAQRLERMGIITKRKPNALPETHPEIPSPQNSYPEEKKPESPPSCEPAPQAAIPPQTKTQLPRPPALNPLPTEFKKSEFDILAEEYSRGINVFVRVAL